MAEGMNALAKRFGIIAGKGRYPLELAHSARKAGVQWLGVLAFQGETSPAIEEQADAVEWVRVGQMQRMIDTFQRWSVVEAVMAGQITPGHLFRDVRPDWRMVKLMAGLKRRNAHTIFGAIAEDLAREGIRLVDSRRYMEETLATEGVMGRRKPTAEVVEDLRYGFEIAKEVSRLDIGQTVVVKNATVLAVEGFEGTDEAIRRGAALGRGRATVVKVSKPKHDARFDVPVVGLTTLEILKEGNIEALGLEAGLTIMLDRAEFLERADAMKLVVYGLGSGHV